MKKPFPFNNGTDEHSKALNRATLVSMIALPVSIIALGLKIYLLLSQ